MSMLISCVYNHLSFGHHVSPLVYFPFSLIVTTDHCWTLVPARNVRRIDSKLHITDPSQTGSLTTLPSVDPSYVSSLATSQHPSQTGLLTIHHQLYHISVEVIIYTSPMKLTRSPLPKIQWRLRTGAEQKQQTKLPIQELAHKPTSVNSSLTLDLDHFLYEC